MTEEELKSLKIGDKVRVQWGANFPKQDGMVLEVKEYASRCAAVVKTERSIGEYVASQIELVERAVARDELAKAVKEFIEKVKDLI